ncbi:rCG33403 [Rattus norvegicus]|uniref:RCG33403 n=1 Tax=Rattus norvegicus TaxID=10116 RepID=A6HK47_RAT|nr:rCG33403 [Rattus norvegicus]
MCSLLGQRGCMVCG